MTKPKNNYNNDTETTAIEIIKYGNRVLKSLSKTVRP